MTSSARAKAHNHQSRNITTLPVALTIAGSDSSGGAGIQADLKTFTVLGVYGASAITALTAQNTLGVAAVHDVPPDFVKAQVSAVATDLEVGAVKVGMLHTADHIRAVAEALRTHKLNPVVLDPVMIATSGARLLNDGATEVLKTEMTPLADLITPNLAEAAALLATSPAENEAEALQQANALIEQGWQAVLIKGGHGKGDRSIDLLVDHKTSTRFDHPRIKTRNTHGTGCTLSAAITAHLALGLDLCEATRTANDYVWRALTASAKLEIGQGSGPLDHAFALKHGQKS